MSESPTSMIGIALLGCGTVGTGVLKLLSEQRQLLQQRTGLRFDVRHIVVRDTGKPRKIPGEFQSASIGPDIAKAIDDPKVQIVVETMGGTTTAGEVIERALKLGKPVVSANKSLLAARGPELFALAKQHNTCIAFEASAGGGIPIIDAISRGLVANRIDALIGILNGTCNVILTRMTRDRSTYAEALAEAQRMGFTEADPTLDVSGRDTAQKLALLGGLAFNARISEQDVQTEGIENIQPPDIAFADSLGYVVKLLAVAERMPGDRLSLRVHPSLVHKDDVLAEVSGGFNAVSLYGHALGHTLFYGRGAGQMPTASAVVADLVNVAIGVTPLSFKRLNIFPDTAAPAKILPPDESQNRYYLRLTVKDQPGVMGQVSQILGRHSISLSAILQPETDETRSPDAPVSIVITTHRASDGAMRNSIRELDQLPTVAAPTTCLRIIDEPTEFAGG